MKDYYKILGVPDNSSQEDIKRAFRKLAFKHHPDTNPGNEKQAEEIFKDINEAYGVLGDKERRQQYDLARKGVFAGAGYGDGYKGFNYSQQDIFTNFFSNRATLEEMSRMFAQAGLRFDQDFLNRVFFTGNSIMFQFFNTPGGAGTRTYQYGDKATYQQHYPVSKPNLIERLISKVVIKVSKFVISKLFGLQHGALPRQNLDHHAELEISSTEAATGGEKEITYKREGQAKTLMVKIPPGVRSGTKIRLKGMGMFAAGNSGDLYLHVKIKD